MAGGQDFSCANEAGGSKRQELMVAQLSYFAQLLTLKIFQCDPMSDLVLDLHNHVAEVRLQMNARPIFVEMMK